MSNDCRRKGELGVLNLKMGQSHGSYEPLPEEKGTYQNPYLTTEVTDTPNKAASVK